MHPLISVFEATEQQTFPLILVIGREPNTHEPTQPVIGRYDFRHHPHCAFWNMSYTFVARSIDLRSPDLKARCVAAAGSPIIYADIHPISLPNHIANKHVHRAKVTPEAITTHLAALFAHTALMARVQVVLFSGLDGAVFQYGRNACMRACAAQAIPVWSVPFFHGVNSRKLQAALTTDLRHVVGSVAQTFCTLEYQETDPHEVSKQHR